MNVTITWAHAASLAAFAGAIITALWRLGSRFGKVTTQLEHIADRLGALQGLPERVARLEGRVDNEPSGVHAMPKAVP